MEFPRELGMADTQPTQKPLSLLRRLIELFTDPDEVVIDPVAGSGSSLVAAAGLGRKAYGFELSKRFFAGACENLKNYVQLDLFNESGQIRKRREWMEQKLFESK